MIYPLPGCLTVDCGYRRSRIRKFVSVGAHAAHGLEQLGLLCHHRYRGANQGECQRHGAKLKRYGWQYIVVDIQWYEPAATGFDYRKNARLTMDAWGWLLPATNRFPSAANGVGFKALADYVHSKGLKFGIHILRGIPRQAVAENTRILGTSSPPGTSPIRTTHPKTAG